MQTAGEAVAQTCEHSRSEAGGTVPAPARGSSSLRGLPPDLTNLLITGRWVVIGTVLLALVLHHPFPLDRPALAVIGLVAAVYNLSQWLLLRSGRLSGNPPAAFVGADLVLVTLLVWYGGGIRGPFEGLFYLVIIIAAAFRDLRGSTLTAVAVTALELLVVVTRPGSVPEPLRMAHLLNTIPYFFLTAAVAGYLVRYLRREWERRHAAEDRLAAVDRELEIAREVQGSLLGQPAPQVPGLAIASYAQPFFGIGGDLQDYVPLPDGVGLVVADISGHSLAAALLAARLSQALEGISLGQPLSQVAALWNQAVCKGTPDEILVTAVFLHVEAWGSTIRYVIAGHPPPLLWRSELARVDALEGHGLLLGALDGARFHVEETTLARGDILLLYTDGAIEARDERGEMLELEGLAALLARHSAIPPEELVARLAEDVRAGREIRDDITLVVVARADEGRQDTPPLAE